MPRAIRFHLDENCTPRVALALRQHGIDVTTAADAGLLGTQTTSTWLTPLPTGARHELGHAERGPSRSATSSPTAVNSCRASPATPATCPGPEAKSPPWCRSARRSHSPRSMGPARPTRPRQRQESLPGQQHRSRRVGRPTPQPLLSAPHAHTDGAARHPSPRSRQRWASPGRAARSHSCPPLLARLVTLHLRPFTAGSKAAAGPGKQKIGSPGGLPQFSACPVRCAPACRGFLRPLERPHGAV